MDILNSVIHAAANADLTNYVYTQVYTSTDTSPTINGVIVNMASGNPIDILVKSISATANVYVIGYPKTLSTSPSTING